MSDGPGTRNRGSAEAAVRDRPPLTSSHDASLHHGIRESFRTRHLQPILIADDDANTLDGLTEFFTDAGYRVAWARDGQEAMNLLVGGLVPILLIIDIAMPHVAGDELLRYVQADPVLRGVPVLVLTGAPERAGRAVADAIVAKPVDLACLLAQVRSLTAHVGTDLHVDGRRRR